jgi:HK97 family phage major capsid protein
MIMTEPTTLGPPSPESPEGVARFEAAIHAKLEAIAMRHEQKMLEGVSEIIAAYERPDRSGIPDLLNRNGESVARLSRPWDSSPERMRLAEPERRLRTFDSDHWNLQWLRSIRDGDFAGRMEADAKLSGIFPDLYRADTLEGVASGVGGFADGTGGVLLPRPLESLVAIALRKIAKMSRWARTYIMTQQEHNIPTAAAATAYMQGEATSPLTGGEPALAQKPLIAHDAIGKLILGRNMLDDEAANIVPVFVQLMGDALAELEDAEFLKAGTGTAPHVTKLAGTAYAEISTGELKFRDVLAMYRNVPQRYRDNAMWLVAGDVLGFMSNVRDGMGRPFYGSLLDPPMAISDASTGDRMAGAVGTLLGKPVHEVDLTAGDIYFGDVSRNYAIGRRRGITVEASKDFFFDTRRVIWIISQRIAGNNIDTSAGQLAAGITSATSL